MGYYQMTVRTERRCLVPSHEAERQVPVKLKTHVWVYPYVAGEAKRAYEEAQRTEKSLKQLGFRPRLVNVVVTRQYGVVQ